MTRLLSVLLAGVASVVSAQYGHHMSNSNGSLANAPYKNPSLPVETRVQDLISRMTVDEKAAQLMQGDISNWLNTTSGAFNHSGLLQNFEQKAGQFYVGYCEPRLRNIEIQRTDTFKVSH